MAVDSYACRGSGLLWCSACRRRTAGLRLIAAAVLVGYLAAAPAFSARPQMFSVLLFAVEVYLLEVARIRPYVALAIPLLTSPWANLHGAFAVGLGLLAIEAIAVALRRDRRACSASSLLACSAGSGCWPIRGAPGCSPMPRGCPPTGSSPGW
jgi:hypothetical protein